MNQTSIDTKAVDTGTPGMRFDIVAGLIAAAVVLPKAMAYATVAGLPAAVGLYTAFVPMVIYALLGTSRVLSASVPPRRWQFSPARNSASPCRMAIQRSSSPRRPR